MENLLNRFIFSEWQHNEGFEQKWLRRITRQTKTQYICDVQHTLLLSEKYNKKYDNGSDYYYIRFDKCAFRMNVKDNKLVERLSDLSNLDGIRKITLIEDFNILKCKYSFDELFNIDVRKILDPNSKLLNRIIDKYNFWKEYKIENDFFIIKTKEINKDHKYAGETVEHLKNLFNRPIYIINDLFYKINTTHEKNIFTNTAIHYHINHFGGDKKIRSRKENYHNVTISFWLFDDKVVFMNEDGINSW